MFDKKELTNQTKVVLYDRMWLWKFLRVCALLFWLISPVVYFCCCGEGICSQSGQIAQEHSGHDPDPISTCTDKEAPSCCQGVGASQMLTLVRERADLEKDLSYMIVQSLDSSFKEQTLPKAIYHPPEA
ncbi:MAG: hypothetical protein A2W07_00420 [candidate division Zixibacteria bacterium RBG_16_43_9]|nr:MAG: hypothetical protein A2W07_00420 [candidate division Zixibacteria bacterium RBG_16_43_9]